MWMGLLGLRCYRECRANGQRHTGTVCVCESVNVCLDRGQPQFKDVL